jgi:DNA-binding NarL/FixJ family response regulator
MTTTVLIADGEPVLREGMAELLASQRDFVVIGAASNADDAVREAHHRRPDVALIGLDLPGGGALFTAGRIRRISPVTRLIVMVPARRETETVFHADAMVSYGSRASQVLSRIRAVGPYGAPPPTALAGDRGCEQGWRVRVQPAGASTPAPGGGDP